MSILQELAEKNKAKGLTNGIPTPSYASGEENMYAYIKGDSVSDLRQLTTNINYGFNTNNVTTFHKPNTMDKGYVFFTRPQLALDDENLLRVSSLGSFLTTDVRSVHYYVRCVLDPRLCYDWQHPTPGDVGNIVYEMFQPTKLACPPMLVNEIPFITLLSNTCRDLSGWPDAKSSFFVTEPNLGGGQTVMVDSHNKERGSFDLSGTFFNPEGNALVLLLQLWRDVQAYTWEGIMHPYPDHIINQLLNYKTAIYRFTLDQYRRKIVVAGKTIAAVQSPDLSKLLDYSIDQELVRADKDINVNFKCEGLDINNPYILIEFNQTMAAGFAPFNKLINADINGSKDRESILNDDSFELELIPPSLRDYFNFRALPFININTRELEWYARKDSKEYQFLVSNI